MAINVSFNGSTIFKPGAYSKTTIDLGGGFPLSPAGIVAIMGESDAGTPGASEVNIADNVYSPDQLAQIRMEYGRGPLVDACNFLFAPGSDGAIPSGAQAVYIYKTNASVRATLTMATDWGTMRSRVWGTAGNSVTFTNTLTAATSATATHSGTYSIASSSIGGQTLTVKVNGSDANTFTATAGTGSDTVGGLQGLLDNTAKWSGGFPTGLVFLVGGTDSAATLRITCSGASNPETEGHGRNFEVISGSLLTSFPISVGLKVASTEYYASLAVSDKKNLMDESAAVGGNIAIKIGRIGGTSPKVTINSTSILLIDSSATEYSLSIADFDTLSQVEAYINSSTGGHWVADLASILVGQKSTAILDQVTNVGASGSAIVLPAQIKTDAYEVREFFALSSMLEQSVLGAKSYVGLPAAKAETYLAGGAKGATLTGDITNALAKFEKFRVNAVVPLFSRDATADHDDGLTNSASDYTIDGIHQAVKTHCSLMATTKKRSERQGYLSSKASYEVCKDKAATMASARIQMVIQDIRQIDAEGVIKWFQPWAGACMLAGARGGSPIGNPMTFKFFNMSGIRQTGQAMTIAEGGIVTDFDPDTQYDNAIQSGITFFEAPQTGGFRCVVDNTTYGKDGNWVYNRANVLYAADILAFDFRNQLESIYVGMKNTVSAAEIKATCESILATYLAQGITVSTGDAKNGFKQLVVQINGNTVNISVVVKLVEGIDFVLADITLQRAQQSA